VHDEIAPGAPHRPVQQLTLEELRARSPQPIELLEEMLELLAGRVGLDLELKKPGYEATVLAQVRSAGLKQLLISSFDERVLRRTRQLDRSIRTGYILTGHGLPARLLKRRMSLRSLLRHTASDLLIPHFSTMGALPPSTLRRAGVAWYSWTVNQPALARQLAAAGAAGIITDRPDLIRSAF